MMMNVMMVMAEACAVLAPDQPAVSPFSEGWGRPPGGAAGRDRVPRDRQLTQPETQQEDPDVAGWPPECLLSPAPPHAQGVYHTPGLRPVCTYDKPPNSYISVLLVTH